jgi:hypothetical protein
MTVRIASLCLTLGLSCSSALADEIVVKNDSLVDGGSVNICPCFEAPEEAAVWLTSPCNGNIVGIQIFWKSFFGGAPQSIEDAIMVYQGGTFPQVGPVKKELLAPLLSDGGLNEFRYEDDNQTVPISIPVTAGETFVVSLRFFNDNANDLSAGTVVSDNDGCQAGRNTVKVNGTTWQSACSLGVSGDWVIRAIIECSTSPTGAVCLPDGSCADGLTEDEAIALGGQFRGVGSECASVSCVGACYVPATGACLQFDAATCTAIGGDWQGPGTTDCNPCVADLNGDGTLNFFDLSAYIGQFNSQNPAADLAAPFGEFNFFDVAAYLGLYNAGCP